MKKRIILVLIIFVLLGLLIGLLVSCSKGGISTEPVKRSALKYTETELLTLKPFFMKHTMKDTNEEITCTFKRSELGNSQ